MTACKAVPNVARGVSSGNLGNHDNEPLRGEPNLFKIGWKIIILIIDIGCSQ